LKKLKPYIFVFAIFLLIFGFIGFFSSIATPKKVGKFYKAKAINERNGIVVDSKDCIYIGDLQGNTIQVFSDSSIFLYGFYINTKGYFSFGIDDEDNIHVIKGYDYHQIFKDGTLISEEEIDKVKVEELRELYQMSDGSILSNWTKGPKYTKDSRIYQLTFFKNVRITNINTNESNLINLDIPKWPLPISIYWLIAAIGLVLVFITYGFKFMRELRRDIFRGSS
jgi:hypothetical protein